MNSATLLISPYLIDMFELRGIRTEQSQGILSFPKHPGIKVWGEAFRGTDPSIIQLDVLVELPDKRVLGESYVGRGGNSSREMVKDALTTFSVGALHVLLSACFTNSADFNTEHDRWSSDGLPHVHCINRPLSGYGIEIHFGVTRARSIINGIPRQIYLGPLTSRYGIPGGMRNDNPLACHVVEWIHDRLRRSSLTPGYHWMRIYHCHNQGQAMANEVVLDNEIWPEAQVELSRLPWPLEPDPNDSRMFLMIRDEKPA